MRKASALLITALIALLAAQPAAPAETNAAYKAEYTVSTVLGPPFAWGIAAERWAELVGLRTNGRIAMKVYPGGRLVQGDQTREFTLLRDGIIDMAVGSTINWSPQIEALNLFALPFLMPDHAAIDALTGGPVGTRLFSIIRAHGVEPLAWGENGFRQVSNSRRPVHAPHDLDGLNIRVVGSPLFSDTFAALGANPIEMSWPEAQAALATGAVDGQENPLAVFFHARMQTLGQTHLTVWNYVADPLIFAVSQHAWAHWSADDRRIVEEAAREAGALCIRLARDGDAKAADVLPDSGVAVVRLTPAEAERFVLATRPVFAKWSERIGADIVQEAQAAIAAGRR
jgi:tripartite ATP-independent transporter DctP family solute receptor